MKAAEAFKVTLNTQRLARLWATPPVAFRPPMHAHAAEPVLNWLQPDELMIDWGGLPSGTTAQLYIPGLRASDTFELLSRRWAERGVSVFDDHTLSFPVGGMSHLPVPALKPGPLAALLTIQLPDSVRKGQVFTVTVHQISTIQDRVVGSFELRIPVAGSGDLIEAENRWLAVLSDTLQKRPSNHRWTPVLARLLKVVIGRVRGFGGNPDEVPPSPKGYNPEQPIPCPDLDAHDGSDKRDAKKPKPQAADDECCCPACTILKTLEDKRIRKTLKALLCKRESY